MAPRLTPQVSTSMSLMRAETIPVGSEVWVDDEKQVWMLVKVVRQDNTILTVRQKTTGDEEEVDLVSCDDILGGKIGKVLHLSV